MVGQGTRALPGFRHRKHRGLAENLGQHAVLFGREMLEQHEGHARVSGQVAEEIGEGLQAAGGGAYSHHQGSGWGEGFGAWGLVVLPPLLGFFLAKVRGAGLSSGLIFFGLNCRLWDCGGGVSFSLGMADPVI
jgi:hypothetical protein